MAPSVVCLINAICAADRRLNLILYRHRADWPRSAPLAADLGRLAWECPVVADLGRLAWEADLGRLAWEHPLVADFGRLARSAPWWLTWVDWPGSALW